MLDGAQPQEESSGIQLLRRRGYHLTPQRYLIFQLLQEAQTHLNVEELIKRVRQHYPNTLYRTPELLEELQLVRGTYSPANII